MPFRIGATVTAIAIAAAVSLAIVGLWQLLETVRDGARAEVEAEHIEADAKALKEASDAAAAAQAERETAFRTGSLGRLRAEWCRDCTQVTQ